jgi:acyl-CoA synthetase (AMP-forming)/AMP-acid ligase II
LIGQLQAYRATDLLVKPSLLVQLIELQHHRPRDLTTLRSIETGSEALAPEVAREAEEFLRCTVLQAYHQTETCGSSNRASTADRTPGSVGGPVPDTDERIINIETEQDVAQGEIGELLIRGPQVMCGYWGDEAATFRALDSDGWLHTGDLVRQEADGQIAIVDRLNDMIKFRGLPIAPAEIEQVLLRHPAVREAAVVPVQFPADGQRPRAFVVLEPGADIAPVELIALIGAELAPHKLPDSLEFVASLPKNAAGKVQRRELTRFTRDKSSPSWGEFSG